MRFLYNIGIYIYKLGIVVSAFFNKKAAKLLKGQSGAFAYLKQHIDPGKKYVWFHAASLGEFEQGRPVIEKMKEEDPEINILLTFFSPSGYEIRKDWDHADAVAYLPLDTPWSARQFVSLVNISKAVFIKYEFWPNYLSQLKKVNIPVYSISAVFRKNQIFFKWYGKWYLGLLRNFKHIFVQDRNSRKLLITYDINNVSVAGDTRFDRVCDLSEKAKPVTAIETFAGGSEKVIVAGSTWGKDEELLIRYLHSHSDVKLILVPHEIHSSHICEIEKLLNGNSVRFTKAGEQELKNANCLIVDTIGLLSSIYRYGKIAYIGGGFGVGIHNTLEAAVWNVPVVFGSNYQRFIEACELVAQGGGFSIHNYDELEGVLDALFENRSAGNYAGEYVRKNTGATDLIISKLMG